MRTFPDALDIILFVIQSRTQIHLTKKGKTPVITLD